MDTLSSLPILPGRDAVEGSHVREPEPPPSGVRLHRPGPPGRPTPPAPPVPRADSPQATSLDVPDRTLVDRAQAGDQAAFAQLVRRHRPRIQRLAVHMLRSRSEADDVAQETFLRAYRALGRFDGRSEAYTWLYRIAVNLCLNVLRSRKAGRVERAGDDPRLEGLVERAPAASGEGPAQRLARREVYEALCEGIDGLSETLRTTLILATVEGRPHDEIAQILGAPEGTTAWRVHEARRKLRAFLAERGLAREAA